MLEYDESIFIQQAPTATTHIDIDQLQRSFQQPPDDARIMVRWWWYGPAVTHDGIDRELAAMKMGNVGGFEVQPTYPLVVDGTGPDGAKNLKFMSPEFLGDAGAHRCQGQGIGIADGPDAGQRLAVRRADVHA